MAQLEFFLFSLNYNDQKKFKTLKPKNGALKLEAHFMGYHIRVVDYAGRFKPNLSDYIYELKTLLDFEKTENKIAINHFINIKNIISFFNSHSIKLPPGDKVTIYPNYRGGSYTNLNAIFINLGDGVSDVLFHEAGHFFGGANGMWPHDPDNLKSILSLERKGITEGWADCIHFFCTAWLTDFKVLDFTLHRYRSFKNFVAYKSGDYNKANFWLPHSIGCVLKSWLYRLIEVEKVDPKFMWQLFLSLSKNHLFNRNYYDYKTIAQFTYDQAKLMGKNGEAQKIKKEWEAHNLKLKG